MATTDDLTLRIKAQGARQSSRDVDRTSGSVRQLGRQTNVAAKGVRSLSREAGRASVSLRTLATGAAAYKIAGAIGGAVSQGFAYNKMIDSQNVAFTTLLGSQKRSAVFMAQIQALALKSPVLDPESTGDSARLLMAYGISAKRTLPFVEALGNMAATTGRSIQESMPRGAMALGQIGSKGRLQSEELNQLAESVGLSRDRIRKALDMTREDFNATLAPGGTNIPASKALPAILEAMRKQSGGAADRLSKTSQGKMDRLREVWKKAMGGLTEDLYDARGNIAGALATIIQDKDLNFGEKVAAARKAVQRELRPLAQQFTGWWRRERVGQLISAEIKKDAPVVGRGLGDAVKGGLPYVTAAARSMGPPVAAAFISGFKAAPAWAQFLTVAYLAKKLGVFRAFGSLAAAAFCPKFVAPCFGGASKAGWIARGTRIGAWMGPTAGLALAAYMLPKFGQAVQDWTGKPGEKPATVGPKGHKIPAVSTQDPHGRSLTSDIAGRILGGAHHPVTDPGLSRGGGQLGPAPIIDLHSHVHLDGKEVAHSVTRHGTKRKSTR